MYTATAFLAALMIALGVGALFLWREPTAAPYGWGVNGIAVPVAGDDGPVRTGIDAAIAAIVARTKGGGNVVEAFQDQGGMRFATPHVSAARAAAVLRARASKHDPEEDIERTARHLEAACRLSERLGCAVSHCLEAVGANHRRESKAYDLKQQAFAGPKATIKLLSTLPAVTILVGEMMGAHPIRFLLTNVVGWICLIVGFLFYGAGLLWTRSMLDSFNQREDSDDNLPIALEMLRAALGQGSSIPGALIAVGAVLDPDRENGGDGHARHRHERRRSDGDRRRRAEGGGRRRGLFGFGRRTPDTETERRPLARGMREAGLALTRGAGWREAWLSANATVLPGRAEGDGHGLDGEERRIGLAALHPSMMVICDCLAESWGHGASPTDRLMLAAREYDREELSAIEQEAARLSVRLLIPSALCFLPSFAMIGIVPAIASLIAG